MTSPHLSDIVIYRSKIDNGTGNDVLSPAMVIRTRATTVAEVATRWADLAPGDTMVVGEPGGEHTTGARPDNFSVELESDEHVDLVVFGLGKTYREYNVAHGNERGQWQLPSLVPEGC